MKCPRGHDYDPRDERVKDIRGECPACLDAACAFDRENLGAILTLQVLDTNEIITARMPRHGRPRRGKPL